MTGHSGRRDFAAPSGAVDQEGWISRLVDQVKDHAIFRLTKDGYAASWNPGVRRVFGFEEDEFVGLRVEELFTPEDRAAGIPDEELAIARASGRADNDRWMLRKGGVAFWASGVTTGVLDDDGRLVGYGKIVRDLTPTRLLQEHLAEIEQRLRLALSAARIGAWRWDLRAGVGTLDATLARMLGLGERDVELRLEEFLPRVHPDDRERIRGEFREALQTQSGLQSEFRVLGSDGSVRWLRDHSEVINGAGGSPRFLTGAAVDITEQRWSEEQIRQSQRMDAVGKLAGGMAHEVNNMMSVVLGVTALMLDELAPGDRRRRDLEHVRAAATRTADVTAQLLAYSRRQLLRPAPLDLGQLIREMEPVLRHILGGARRLTVSVGATTSLALADRGSIEQVLVNLALNARDATRLGDEIIIETSNMVLDAAFLAAHPGANLTAGPYVVLAVTDTGHGMDTATMARAFEPFFTTKPTGQGSGLGLSVVHGIVRQSGGDILVESTPGRGADFRIYLPALSPGPVAESSEPEAASKEPGVWSVLVVEDEPMVRAVVVRMLVQRGFRCLEAADGAEALRILEAAKEPIDAVVTDIVMPHVSGRELADRLALAWPGLPVLFMSGYTDDEMVRRELLIPGAPFIQKPFDADALVERLRSLLAARAHARPST